MVVARSLDTLPASSQSHVDTHLDGINSTKPVRLLSCPCIASVASGRQLSNDDFLLTYKREPLRRHHDPEMTASSPSHLPFPHVATKAASTAQFSQLNALADSKVAPDRATTHRPLSGPKIRRDAPTSIQDSTSDRVTLSLIRKTLVADGTHATGSRLSPAPIEGILPPLTSSNDVDVQLYAIVAIIIRDFVNSWYSKISPDHTFVDEVIQIIAHCSRAVEERLRQIDITELILDDGAALIERHVVGKQEPPMTVTQSSLAPLTIAISSLSHGIYGSSCSTVWRKPTSNLSRLESTSSSRPFPVR